MKIPIIFASILVKPVVDPCSLHQIKLRMKWIGEGEWVLLARLVVCWIKLFTFIRCVYAMSKRCWNFWIKDCTYRNLDDMHNSHNLCDKHMVNDKLLYKALPISNVVCLPRKDYNSIYRYMNAGAIWEIYLWMSIYVSDPCTYKINVVQEWCRFTQAGSPRWLVEGRGRVVLVHKTNDTNKRAVTMIH